MIEPSRQNVPNRREVRVAFCFFQNEWTHTMEEFPISDQNQHFTVGSNVTPSASS